MTRTQWFVVGFLLALLTKNSAFVVMGILFGVLFGKRGG